MAKANMGTLLRRLRLISGYTALVLMYSFFVGSTNAHAQRIEINSSNSWQFISLGLESKFKEAICLTRPKLLPGIKITSQSLTGKKILFESYASIIKRLKAKRPQTARVRAVIKSNIKKRSRFAALCKQRINQFGLPEPTVSPSVSPTTSPTATPTDRPSASLSPTPFVIQTAFPTQTASPSASPSPIFSSSPSVSPTQSPAPTATLSPSVSPSATGTSSPSSSPTASASQSSTASPSPTNTASPSLSPSASASATSSPTLSPTISPTASATRSPSPTASASPTPSASASPTRSPSPAPTLSQKRIRAGTNTSYTDTLGNIWQGDTGLNIGGLAFAPAPPPPIENTDDDPLYQTERYGADFSYHIPVVNGVYHVKLHFAEIFSGWSDPGNRVFNVSLEGNQVETNLDLIARVGTRTPYIGEYDTTITDGFVDIRLQKIVDNAKISAIEILPNVHAGDPFLHAVITAPNYLVDYDSNGSEAVLLDGRGSHTHEPGHQLVSWTWFRNLVGIGSGNLLNTTLPLGDNQIKITIADDNLPAHTLSAEQAIPVYPINSVAGIEAKYYQSGGMALTSLLDSLPSNFDYFEILPSYLINAKQDKIGGSQFTGDIVVSAKASVDISSSASYNFVAIGGSDSRILIDGTLVLGPVNLTAGAHGVEARFAVPDASFLPLNVKISQNGGANNDILLSSIHHDESQYKPFIQSMNNSGPASGGDDIEITGLGFFPAASVILHWGGQTFTGPSLQINQGKIAFTTPAGTGTISVFVETPLGNSNSVNYQYNSGVPISFNPATAVTAISPLDQFEGPSQAAWGPDGRLYVATTGGKIFAYTFNDLYQVTNTQIITAVADNFPGNPSILGIAFNPLDPPGQIKIYVSHSLLYAAGGQCVTRSDFVPYSGQVSVVSGPDFISALPLITGLPVSNHDHAINGLQFDNYGDLYIAVGGNTNAGVHACAIGDIPETPFSGAILKANVSKVGFRGTIHYREAASGLINDNETLIPPGAANAPIEPRLDVDVDPFNPVDIDVFAAGFRNPFDLVWSTRGILYGTENGPNTGFGPASTSATTQAEDPSNPDELNQIVQGQYYGHPNRNRGRNDSRQNIYRAPTVASILGQYTQPLASGHPIPSTNGIDEYRATAFGGSLRGALLAKRWFSEFPGELYQAFLNDEGNSITQLKVPLDGAALKTPGLDVVGSPGGGIMFVDYSNHALNLSLPNEVVVGMQAYDIFPWRAQAGAKFVIGGIGFGNLANTTVKFGNNTATLSSVSSTRISGTVPASVDLTSAFVDISVLSASQTYTITKAFRYVFPGGQGKGIWQQGKALPFALGEVAAEVINGVMYLVGDGELNPLGVNTLAYDLGARTWTQLAPRPFTGNHHAAISFNNKIYLIGGLGNSAEGKVQIYDPSNNTWSLGANLPADLGQGALSAVLIEGKIYAAGGILGSATTNTLRVYDPGTNTWSSNNPNTNSALPNMPVGRNHAAYGTDGSNFYIFGGRDGGNIVAPGFADVMIFNPVANTWAWSGDGVSNIQQLPLARGGMGKAAFFRGEFFVMGGETTLPGVPFGVYNRVDVYNPTTKTWRNTTPMIFARHGIYPIVANGRILVAGGGLQAGHSASSITEYYTE